jgi:hypothetical protein
VVILPLGENSGHRFNLVDVDEQAVIADSQLDYPGCDGGWQFMASDSHGNLSPLVPRDIGQEWTTRYSYRVGANDEFCKLGRDFIHPGYRLQPTLAWTAPSNKLIDLRGEFGCLSPLAQGAAKVSVIVGGEVILTEALRHPEILRFNVKLHVLAGEVLTVRFAAESVIDHLSGIYYAWICEAGQPPDDRRERCVEKRINATVDAAWQDAYAAVATLGSVPDECIADAAHRGFDGHIDLPKFSRDSFFGDPSAPGNPSGFGRPRYFSASSGGNS